MLMALIPRYSTIIGQKTLINSYLRCIEVIVREQRCLMSQQTGNFQIFLFISDINANF